MSPSQVKEEKVRDLLSRLPVLMGDKDSFLLQSTLQGGVQLSFPNYKYLFFSLENEPFWKQRKF